MKDKINKLVDTITDNCKIASGTPKITADIYRQLNTLKMEVKDTIYIAWGVADVLHQAEQDKVELTKEQAREILDILKHKHDSNEGINWVVISTVISLYTGNMYVNQEKYGH